MDIKRQQFLEELTELSKKYNLYIHGRGCCDSSFIMNGEPHWTNGEIGWNKKAGRYIDWGGIEMKIKAILNQHRRDFRADYECEHCGAVEKNKRGYDDRNFHENVIPTMKCPACGMTADESYRPLTTKYPEGYQI